jgi:DNA-binding beta-propeller fold protein YncE
MWNFNDWFCRWVWIIRALFNGIRGIAIYEGTIYVADSVNSRVRAVTRSGNVSTFAGNGRVLVQDGPLSTALFAHPFDIAIDPAGNMFVLERLGGTVRLIKKSQSRLSKKEQNFKVLI